jgi:F-type H+-transporting ATPase subunit delta
MIGSAVGKRYASALYALAHEAEVVEKIGADLAALAEAWAANEELRHVFSNPGFLPEQKRSVVTALAERLSAHPLLRNTLLLLADRRRLVHLPEIAAAYRAIAERRAGLVRAEIVTAVKLPEAYYRELENTLRQATGKDVLLVRREDPSLIGGVVTTVGGRVFDGSLKNRLRGLRSQLLAATDPAVLASSSD